MIPGYLLSAFPHRQFHTLPGLLDSWAALPNSYPNALRAMQGGSLYHFYDGLWYDPVRTRTHDLLCERRTTCGLSRESDVKLKTQIIYYSYLVRCSRCYRRVIFDVEKTIPQACFAYQRNKIYN